MKGKLMNIIFTFILSDSFIFEVQRLQGGLRLSSS